MLTHHSRCQVKWLRNLIATDMLIMLLQIAGLATQEIDIVTYPDEDACIVQEIIHQILPEMMMEQYYHDDGELIIATSWKRFLNTLQRDESNGLGLSTCAGLPTLITMEELMNKIKEAHAHSKQFHQRVAKYSCCEHTNVVKH
jgi:hypothetical protein